MSEKKKGFVLADVLGDAPDVSRSNTGREQIEYIDIDCIEADPNNFYSLDGIDELAGNIELVGLQQPVRLRPKADTPGRYVLISGHRRWTALKLLVGEGKDTFRQVPSIVEQNAGSTALQELKLIYANSATRDLSPADLSKQAERVEALLYQLKEEGVEFPGRMRDHVAEACKVSAAKLARLKVIQEKLVEPRWAEEWKSGDLPEQSAYALARMPAIMQHVVALVCTNKPTPSGYRLENAQKLGLDKYLTVSSTCPDTKEGCTNGKQFLAHDLDPKFWCDCPRICCMTCLDRDRCKFRCAKATEKVKEEQKERRARDKADRDAVKAREQRLRDFNLAFGRQLAAACNSSADDTVVYDTLVHDINVNIFGGVISGWQYNLKAFAFNDGGPYVDLDIPVIALAEFCRALNISADWLLGLPERSSGSPAGVPTPPGWRPGTEQPDHPCLGLVSMYLTGDETLERVVRFDGTEWRYDSGVKVRDINWWLEIQEIPKKEGAQ